MRRILIFSLVYYPRYVGGAEVAVKEITDRISPQEIEFDMITLRTEEKAFERIGNVNVYRIGPKWLGNPRSPIFYLLKYNFIHWAFFKAVRLHSKKKYDMTWAIMANFAGAAAFHFKLFKPKIPFLLTLQEGDSFEHIKKRVHITYPIFKMMFGKADRIQAISNYLADWARSMGAKCPVEVVPNGVDYDLFARQIDLPGTNSNRLKMRASFGFDNLKDSDAVLVTSSRLVKKNAVDDIISALQYLDASVKLLILGTGADESELKGLCSKLKLNDRVVFKGFVPHSELPNYLQASDIFIRPSRSEGLGNSFLEAMAAGIPVIATPVGGIPDFLIDGQTGLFCEVNNPKSIVQKVDKLMKDREARDYIVKNSREMVEKKYRWEGIAEKMKRIFIGV